MTYNTRSETIVNAPVTYIPDFVAEPDAVFERLRAIHWERRPDAPRCEYYCNDVPRPYAYGRGRGRRIYEPRPYPADVLIIRKALEALAGVSFEVCSEPLPEPVRSPGLHADDSPEMDDARPIASVSLGEKIAKGGRVERYIRFRPQTDKSPESIERLKLQHGSLCLMAPGMQDRYFHGIPRSGDQCGERISLTFRGYVDVVEQPVVTAPCIDM